MTREALLQKAREQAAKLWPEAWPTFVAIERQYKSTKLTDELLNGLADFCLSELAAENEELTRAHQALADAALEINCAGPVDHRIRILKQEFSSALQSKDLEIEKLRKALELYRASHNVCIAGSPQGLCNKCRIAEAALQQEGPEK